MRAYLAETCVARWEYEALNEQQMQFFHEVFDSSLSRLGPGTEASTLRALRTVLEAARRPEEATGTVWPRVLDLGCGTGAQSILLARHLDGPILAIDNHQPYLDAARRRAEAAGVADRIVTSLQDMRVVDYDAGSFDVIWSEGAIFGMGLREGLEKTRRWLTPGGFLALTELCWLKANPPEACRSFLEGHYPVMTDIDGNLAAIRASGYTVLDHFVQPESAWTDEFYNPLEARVASLRARHAGDAGRIDVIEMVQAEIDLYRKYSEYYGYVFCVMQR